MALLAGLVAGVLIGGLAYRRAPKTPEWVGWASAVSGFLGGLWVGWVVFGQLVS